VYSLISERMTHNDVCIVEKLLGIDFLELIAPSESAFLRVRGANTEPFSAVEMSDNTDVVADQRLACGAVLEIACEIHSTCTYANLTEIAKTVRQLIKL
jgi:hypothetical protein